MARIFISYRRDDSKDITGRIYDRLKQKYGAKNIFKDVDDIPYGVDFRDVVAESVEKCDVMLAIIGNKWSTIIDEEGNLRLKNENDYVRMELEAGLKKGIPVIPILVNNSAMPKKNLLPKSLHKLLFRNGLSIKDDPYFDNGILKLFNSLNKILLKKKQWYPYLLAIFMIFLVSTYIYIDKPSTPLDSPEKIINPKVEDQDEDIVYLADQEPLDDSPSITDMDIVQANLNTNNYMLKIGTIPKDAKVTLNGNINYTWSMTLPKGKYKVLVQRGNYHDKTFDIDLNKNIYKSVRLRRKTYTLKIVPNVSRADIKILNIAPKYKDNIRLNGNIRYSIAVSKEGYYDKYFTLKPLNENTTLKVSLKKRKEKKRHFTLKIKPIYKRRFLSTKGNGIQVKIMNIAKKYKDNISLEQGVYDIEVSKKGCRTRKFSTYLRSNEAIKVKLCK